MKNRISITAVRKAGTSIVLAAAIACAAAGCGKSSDDSSASLSAASTDSTAQSDTSETSGETASDTGTGSDFAKVISEDSSDSNPEPTELEVGNLTLEVPGYYSLDTDNSSGSDIDKIYSYEVGNTGIHT